jgi:hypothetical protein
VYYKSGNNEACIDMIGVSKSNGLQLWTDADSENNPAFASSDKYFKSVYKPGMNPTQLQELCTKAMEKGYTWEGITNGESCTFRRS